MENNIKLSIDIFCKVIDNFGDIGVCLRLAKELTLHHATVHIYVDDLVTLQKICPDIDVTLEQQYDNASQLFIHKWLPNNNNYQASRVVIEAFACNLDECYTSKFTSQTLWINLEYLSAETWVETCHKMPSLQASGIRKYFFFPGFSAKTGGLNFSPSFLQLQSNEARQKVIHRFQLPIEVGHSFLCHIFTYPNPALIALIHSIIDTAQSNPICFLLPQGLSTTYLNGLPEFQSVKQSYPQVKFHTYPMVDQAFFNTILKACDLNIVRGEDSVTQAIMTGKPFLWHIYPQDENAHIDKLQAFLQQLYGTASIELQIVLKQAFLNFNLEQVSAQDRYTSFYNFMLKYGDIYDYNKHVVNRLSQNGSLCDNLLNFIHSVL